MQQLFISGATLIDAVADHPREGQSIWIEGERIKAIGRRDDFPARVPAHTAIDVSGKFVIPGLMNANVHLLCDIRLEILARYLDRYEDLIAEAAQIALKGGLTTVFDTWGPRRHLIAVRDRIAAGAVPGSRLFCAGNIIGFEGPFSHDYLGRHMEAVSASLRRHFNALWAENVGRHLMWLTPEQVAQEVRAYIARGIDFVKYGSNEHFGTSAGAFLMFSQEVQRAIVREAHRAGITAQAHTMSVEGLRIAVEAGCDLIQHANITGPVTIPDTTLELMARRGTGAVVFPWTEQGLSWIMANVPEAQRAMWRSSDANARNLIRSGTPLLMANDGAILAPEALTDPAFAQNWSGAPEEEGLFPLVKGHFNWFRAMEEKGCPPMQMLRAATRNIAVAYGQEKDLGTLEAGKFADLLVLDENPLEAAKNYRSIRMICKSGTIIDPETLPLSPVLTRPIVPPIEEEERYVPFLRAEGALFPMCPCAWHG